MLKPQVSYLCGDNSIAVSSMQKARARAGSWSFSSIEWSEAKSAVIPVTGGEARYIEKLLYVRRVSVQPAGGRCASA